MTGTVFNVLPDYVCWVVVWPAEELASPAIHRDLPVPNHRRPYPVAFVEVVVHAIGVEPKRNKLF